MDTKLSEQVESLRQEMNSGVNDQCREIEGDFDEKLKQVESEFGIIIKNLQKHII